MKSNQEKTIKVPTVVHRALKQLATARGVPLYSVLAQLLLLEINKEINMNEIDHECERKKT